MAAKELSAGEELDKTGMITYLSKFYELFRGTPLPVSGTQHDSTKLCFSLLFSTLFQLNLSPTWLFSA